MQKKSAIGLGIAFKVLFFSFYCTLYLMYRFLLTEKEKIHIVSALDYAAIYVFYGPPLMSM